MIELKAFDLKLINDEYVSWLNDPVVMKYIDHSSFGVSLEELRNWVESVAASDQQHLMSVHVDDLHIGNVKFGNIDRLRKCAEIGLLIGKADFRSKGYGKQILSAATSFAFQNLDLVRLIAGVHVNNTSSLISFIKEGFTIYEYLELRKRNLQGDQIRMVMLELTRVTLHTD
jgi:RimJ/RimL family protein N-acetyltransferase